MTELERLNITEQELWDRRDDIVHAAVRRVHGLDALTARRVFAAMWCWVLNTGTDIMEREAGQRARKGEEDRAQN